MGTVVDSPADFYRRIPKKDRKKTILEELYNDTKVKKYDCVFLKYLREKHKFVFLLRLDLIKNVTLKLKKQIVDVYQL